MTSICRVLYYLTYDSFTPSKVLEKSLWATKRLRLMVLLLKQKEVQQHTSSKMTGPSYPVLLLSLEGDNSIDYLWRNHTAAFTLLSSQHLFMHW